MHKKRRIIAILVLISTIVTVYFLLSHYWYQPTYNFVYTDNSRIDGAIVKVVAENRGQVIDLLYDTDDYVERLQKVATLKVLNPTGLPGQGGQRYFYQNILSPISGTIISKDVNPGDTVLPGQTLLTIVDLDDLWVIANIDENDVNRVKPGQRVDIHVDATDDILKGTIEYIIPSTTSIVQRMADRSLIVAANTQDVPVKIRFEQKNNYRLYPGLSTEVTIYTK